MRWFATVVCAALTAAACSEPAQSPPVDAAIDAVPSACLACDANQICVATYDGTCRSRGVTCVARTVDCPSNACSPACESAYCGSPFQCQTRSPCGGEPPEAFTCYGP
jgi:hypothetical protein